MTRYKLRCFWCGNEFAAARAFSRMDSSGRSCEVCVELPIVERAARYNARRDGQRRPGFDPTLTVRFDPSVIRVSEAKPKKKTRPAPRAQPDEVQEEWQMKTAEETQSEREFAVVQFLRNNGGIAKRKVILRQCGIPSGSSTGFFRLAVAREVLVEEDDGEFGLPNWTDFVPPERPVEEALMDAAGVETLDSSEIESNGTGLPSKHGGFKDVWLDERVYDAIAMDGPLKTMQVATKADVTVEQLEGSLSRLLAAKAIAQTDPPGRQYFIPGVQDPTVPQGKAAHDDARAYQDAVVTPPEKDVLEAYEAVTGLPSFDGPDLDESQLRVPEPDPPAIPGFNVDRQPFVDDGPSESSDGAEFEVQETEGASARVAEVSARTTAETLADMMRQTQRGPGFSGGSLPEWPTVLTPFLKKPRQEPTMPEGDPWVQLRWTTTKRFADVLLDKLEEEGFSADVANVANRLEKLLAEIDKWVEWVAEQ